MGQALSKALAFLSSETWAKGAMLYDKLVSPSSSRQCAFSAEQCLDACPRHHALRR